MADKNSLSLPGRAPLVYGHHEVRKAPLDTNVRYAAIVRLREKESRLFIEQPLAAKGAFPNQVDIATLPRGAATATAPARARLRRIHSSIQPLPHSSNTASGCSTTMTTPSRSRHEELSMKRWFTLALVAALFSVSVAGAQPVKPTIVLVHGAFADATSWRGVIQILEADGYKALAVANPLRSLKGDAQYVTDLLSALDSPVILVGHSYGGSVVSEAAASASNVKALVYVAAFAPEVGETAIGLSAKFPGSSLGSALAPPVALTAGGKDLYIEPAKFHHQFAADVSAADAAVMAAAQRPVTEGALNESASAAAWKNRPSWFIYGDQDLNIPLQALTFMAERAGSRQTQVVRGASHAVMVSNPQAVASMIEHAASELLTSS